MIIRSTIRLGLVCALVLLASSSLTAHAATGTADSPLFELNTLWAADTGGPSEAPHRNRLGGCYPNPFNPLTTINFEVGERTTVNLRIYDLQGHLVRSLLADELLAAGGHRATWDGRDDHGNQTAAGVYLYRLVTPKFTASRSMILLK